MTTLIQIMYDFASVSLLLLLGYQLRKHIKLLQNYFIPVSLIAGGTRFTFRTTGIG